MKHIILVEDDPAIQDSLSSFFETLNINVTVYANGNAILAGDYTVPDLFLLDKQLPGVDGLDICKHLKSGANTKHIPVFMMSASPSVIQLAKTADADQAIVKPFTLTELSQLIMHYLDK